MAVESQPGASVLALALAACLGFSTARADEDTWALDRVSLHLGTYVNDLALNSRVNGRVDGTGTQLDGTEIDYSRDFDLGGEFGRYDCRLVVAEGGRCVAEGDLKVFQSPQWVAELKGAGK